MAERVRQNITFYFAFEEIVGGLNSVQRRNRFEARHFFRRIVAHSNRTNLPLVVEFTKSGGRLLDGNKRIRPMHLIYINVARLKTSERVLEFLENASTSGGSLDSAGGPVDAYFRRYNDAFAASVLPQGFAHDFFGAPLTVDGCGIDQIDSLIERRVNRANRLFLIGSAPHPAADGPSAECDSGTNEICAGDFDVFQHVALSLCLFETRFFLAANQNRITLVLCR